MIVNMDGFSLEAMFAVLTALADRLDVEQETFASWQRKQKNTNEGLSDLGWSMIAEPFQALTLEFHRVRAKIRKEHPERYVQWLRGRTNRKGD